MKKYLCKIPLQFFGDDPAPSDPAPQDPPAPSEPSESALSQLTAAYELRLAEVTRERDLARAENIEYQKAIRSILNGRPTPNPEAPDAAAFAKSCKF